jgi:hypothetical protein
MVIARTFDIMLCGWIWRNYDVTISTMTGLELRKTVPKEWAVILGGFLNGLQYAIEHIMGWPHGLNHCEGAIAADITRLQQAAIILGVKL